MQRINNELNKLEADNQLRKIPETSNKYGNFIKINGNDYLNLSSNDYLSISTNLALRDEFLALNKSLLSSASARLLSGSSNEYNELESTVAKLFAKEKCLIFIRKG